MTVLNSAACSGRLNVFTETRNERLNRLDDERARLNRTTGPVDRTRVQVRISDLLVGLMNDAIGDGDIETLDQRMMEYRSTVTSARDTMLESGRNAANNSAGFRDLEIALRQHDRQLQDIGSRLTFEFREPINQLRDDVAEIRNELLGALFPGQNSF